MIDQFEVWLRSLPPLGYDRLWVSNNLPALRQRFDDTGGAPMEPCPPPPESRARDRYGEL